MQDTTGKARAMTMRRREIRSPPSYSHSTSWPPIVSTRPLLPSNDSEDGVASVLSDDTGRTPIPIRTEVPSHITIMLVSLYVLSGVTQPLLMEIAKQAGIADKTCQIYMFGEF